MSLVILAGLSANARADGGKQIDDVFTTGVLAVFVHTTGTEAGTGADFVSRSSGSLIGALRAARTPTPGLRVTDWWSLDFGVGGLTKVGVFLDFRLEATVRPILTVSENLEIFSRLGYFTGSRVAPSEKGRRGYDAWIATVGARVDRLFAEAGAGVSASNGSSFKYLLGDLSYRVSPTGIFQDVGIRVEDFPGMRGGDDLNVSLTAGSH